MINWIPLYLLGIYYPKLIICYSRLWLWQPLVHHQMKVEPFFHLTLVLTIINDKNVRKIIRFSLLMRSGPLYSISSVIHALVFMYYCQIFSTEDYSKTSQMWKYWFKLSWYEMFIELNGIWKLQNFSVF